LLYADNAAKDPTSWSSDGKYVLFTRSGPETRSDIWVLPMTPEGSGKPFPFVETPFEELNGRFSPDGRWVAYSSTEPGRPEVFVVPFPGPGGKRQISTGGGRNPTWRADGREIFYVSPDETLMAAEVAVKGASIETSQIQSLGIAVKNEGTGARGNLYDVSTDGQRFLVAAESKREGGHSPPLTLVQNWKAMLKK
jgi:eukaryotic-like serine/threonine-protein kinase